MSVLRGYEDKDDKLHYLIPYLAKWIEYQVTKNIRFYRFWTMVSIWERKSELKNSFTFERYYRVSHWWLLKALIQFKKCV